MASAAACGMSDSCACVRASAISNCKSAANTEWSENTSASASVVARLSIRRTAKTSSVRLKRWNSPNTPSNIEEYRLVLAAKVDSKTPPPRTRRIRHGDQRSSPLRRNQRQYRILLIGGIARKINTRRQTLQQSPRKNRDVHVRRLHNALMPRHGAGNHRLKYARSVRTSCQSAETTTRRIVYCRLHVFRMGILAVCIRLPDFDHGIGDRRAFAVQYSAFEMDVLAPGFGFCNERPRTRVRHPYVQVRAGGL